ncbi:MAG: cytochrome c biogenesis protein CcsA [Euryarchaeota archaeon]|nr:cytochrome c biogenesis protein CcsA [Euryarchaeota archaeon]
MTGGGILLYAALICELLAAVVLLLCGKYRINLTHILTIARLALFFQSGAIGLMIYYFIKDNFSVLYVWQYSASWMQLPYKIAAVFAGQQGTYLLWAWASVLAAWFIIEDYGFKNPLLRKTELIAVIISIFILLLCIRSEPFMQITELTDHTPIPVEGNGLNPVFITIWMVIHPFVTFIAYAATVVPASAATAHLITGREGWHKISRQWLRISWMFLSVCMVTGGVWAYKLVGWGGFWNWDPVQTATLILWLLATAVLHILARYHEGKEYTTAAPVATIFLFIATIYVTLVTRQGIIHSLHDFPGTPTYGLLVVGIIVAIIVATGLGICKFLRTRVTHTPLKSVFSTRNTFLWTNILLITIAFVCFWGLTYSFVSQHLFSTKIIIPSEFFNVWCFIPAILLVSLTGVCMAYGRIHDTSLKYILLFILALSLLLAMLPGHKLLGSGGEFYQTSSIIIKALGSISVWAFVPAFLFAFIAILSKFSVDFKRMHGRMRFRTTGINLIHIGFILVMAGAIVTTSFDISSSVVYNVDELCTKKDMGNGWSMELAEFNVLQNPDGTWTQTAHLNVYKDGNPYCSGATGFTSTQHFGDVHDPMINRGIARDVYAQFSGTRSHISTEAIVPISIKIIPGTSLLWTGCILMLIGILCIIISIYLLVMKKRKLLTRSTRGDVT